MKIQLQVPYTAWPTHDSEGFWALQGSLNAVGRSVIHAVMNNLQTLVK